METSDDMRNRTYVAKSRLNIINSIGIDEYRRRMAQKQREYRAKRKAVKNPHIQDRKLKSVNTKELFEVRRELKHEEKEKRKKKMIFLI